MSIPFLADNELGLGISPVDGCGALTLSDLTSIKISFIAPQIPEDCRSSCSSVFQVPAMNRGLNLQTFVNKSTPMYYSDCSTLHRFFTSHARQFMAFFFFSRVYDLTRVLYTMLVMLWNWIKTSLQETAHTLSAITSYKSLSCLDRRRMARISRLHSPIQRSCRGFEQSSITCRA